jgi:polar amino acid transport system substrate-binding protein
MRCLPLRQASRLLQSVAALIGALMIFAGPCLAQTPAATAPATSSQRELVVGTKEAAPFAMKDADGVWHGISIDLWRRIADQLHLHYRFSEAADVKELLDGVAAGRLDIAVAALTVTAERAQILNFTQPFYVTGLGIAVPAGGDASWLPIVRAMTSFGFAQAIAALVGLALIVGFLVWFFERRHNDDFGGGPTQGISSGVWWSAMTMTQRGAGNFGPRTLPGRIVAVLWMVGSIVMVAVFTAGITSALTVKHLHGMVHNTSDLSGVRVGAVTGTSSEDSLSRMRISYQKFPTPHDGLVALRKNTIDALVYDRPLLAWIIQRDFSSSIELIDTTFEPQEYAFALPLNSPLEKTINVAVLETTHGDWWEQTTFRYLGSR